MPVLTRLEELLAAYLSLLDNVATFLLTFALVYVIGRIVVRPLVSAALGVRDTERTLKEGLEGVVAIGVVTIAVVVGLSIAGLGFVLERAAILVAALTVALGFAAQNVVGNFVSGAFIVTDPSFSIGDWIRWDDQEGIIEDISFRSTRVRTFDNEIVTVPNSELTASAVTNAVLEDRLRVRVSVAVSYDDDLDAVTRLLTDAAADHPDILAEPEPTARIVGLGDGVQIVALCWIADPDRGTYGRVRSEYAREIVARLEREGIDLGTAQGPVAPSAGAGPSPTARAVDGGDGGQG
ncbi:mechanosensitive ion channel family protein [Natrinema sp. 1APR25-10V2]|uniref:mechanosensitive ion channel family protein n=1 Tax=Natrinema sp. 1APR25-10V2 TaxID=2951081 RepID=UPI0028754B85|nr:mechanosensitive ion channel family protein [Natrinema sp. 1APR25-10V2]MDS0473609.1 mechanosensitive ion channel family protein [Natrinema sp. 1APR25-10V2]